MNLNVSDETKKKLYFTTGGVVVLFGLLAFLKHHLSEYEFYGTLILMAMGGYKIMDFINDQRYKQEKFSHEQGKLFQSDFYEALRPFLDPISRQMKLALPINSSFHSFRESDTWFFFKLKLSRRQIQLINEDDLLPLDMILQDYINESLLDVNKNRFRFMKKYFTTEELRNLVENGMTPIIVKRINQETAGVFIDFEIHKQTSNYFYQSRSTKKRPKKSLFGLNHNTPEINGAKIPIAIKEQLVEAGVPATKSQLYWNFEKYPHVILSGSSGSGKSSLLYEVMYNLVFIKNIKIIFSDFKGDDSLEFLSEYDHYYKYKDAYKGLEMLYGYLQDRQGGNKDRSPVFLLFDEYASFIASNDKKTADKYKAMLSEIAMMGRSFNLHLLLSMQRIMYTLVKTRNSSSVVMNSFLD